MRVRLTKRAVDAAEPRGTEFYLWDRELPGFGLRVRPTGSKVYLYRYGAGVHGRTRKIMLGAHGKVTADAARARAERLRGAVASGEDPAAVRDAAKATPTVEAFAQRYLEEHAVPHKRPSSVEQDRGYIRRAIVPRLGRLRIDKVIRADVAALHHARRDTPIDANRVLALLSKMFSLAEAYGLRPQGTNPSRGIKRYRENRRERFLSDSELARLGTALSDAENGGEALFAVAALRLLVLTGARRGEILGAKWQDVDFEAGVLRVARPKEGRPKAVRLGPPALSILSSLPRVEGNPYVIVGRVHGSPFVGLQDVWERVRAKAGLEDVRIHDLRHAFASVAVAGGASLPVIGALLGHRQAATTQRYAHLSDDPLRSVADATSQRIAAALRQDTDPGRTAALGVVVKRA